MNPPPVVRPAPPPPPSGDHLPPTYPSATPPPPPPSASPSYTLPGSGAFHWIPSLAQARETARAQGKLIFLETGRDACGNCQALKNKIIPQPSVASELGAIAVGYYDDCDRDPNSAAYRVLKDNLPSAVMLPLVGWVTPDMRWVYGFSGHRDEARFRQDIATARATYLRMAEGERPAAPERELAQAPVRAVLVPTSLPAEEIADVSELGEDVFAPEAAPAPVVQEPAFETTPAPLPIEVAPPEAPAVPEVVVAPEAVAPAPLAPPAPPAPPVEAPAPPAPVVVSSPVKTTVPVATADEAVRTWARDALRRAADALRARDVAGARTLLAEVRARAQGAPEAREAEKGDVAIRALRRLDAAPAADAPALRADAARALQGTVWADLFS
jgi:hypothetical protein